MDEAAPVSTPLGERLARLEGILVGIQSSITQSRADGAAFMARVERLEQRQVEIEREMITRDDIADLAADVKALSAASATQRGGTALAGWGAQTLGSWAAVIIALLALVGVGTSRHTPHTPHTPPVNPAPAQPGR